MGRAVRIVDHDPKWAKLFESEREKIASACDELVQAIEHIGSSSVPGLPSKPIVDVLVGVRESSLLSTLAEKTGTPNTTEDIEPAGNDNHVRLVNAFKKIGYVYRGENGIPKRLFFEVHDEGRELHVHVVKRDSTFYREHLLFRDYLRGHPDVAKQYGELKRRLAKEHGEDREAYTAAKTSFIRQCVRAAQSWVAGR